jgi:hypothetical protein
MAVCSQIQPAAETQLISLQSVNDTVQSKITPTLVAQ